MKSILAWTLLACALATWGGFAYLSTILTSERMAYADALALAEKEALRGEAATRLRSAVQGSESERVALESAMSMSLLRAVETIEGVGRRAGATAVAIGEATPLGTSKDISQTTIVVNAQGSFTSLMRAVTLYETIPLPATVEQFEISKTDTLWRLTVRLRLSTATPQAAATTTPSL